MILRGVLCCRALFHLWNRVGLNGGHMLWIVANIHRIMIVSGVLTMTMVYAAIAPEAALRSTFGDSLEGPVADVVVRNWGALLALIGAVPGGKKGAAIGATAGGVGGLIYDLATRDRDKGK
jgi:hypothetical protein